MQITGHECFEFDNTVALYSYPFAMGSRQDNKAMPAFCGRNGLKLLAAHHIRHFVLSAYRNTGYNPDWCVVAHRFQIGR